MAENPLNIDNYNAKAKKYNSCAFTWKIIYWSVGTMGVACSCLAASQTKLGVSTALFSVIAATSIGFMGFAYPMKQANKYDQAANILTIAVDKFQCGLYTSQELIDAYESALKVLTADVDWKLPK